MFILGLRTSARVGADAPDSDQPFLSRFGLKVQQDNGKYALSALGGRFRRAEPSGAAGRELVRRRRRQPDRRAGDCARGREDRPRRRRARQDAQQRRDEQREQIRRLAAAGHSRDASLVLANAGKGRVVGYFDRNTFFNLTAPARTSRD
jgi:hypothetical protein